MYWKYIALLISLIGTTLAIYPYFDTQDFIYNVPKVYRISLTLDKLLEYYEKKPSKDPEWYIALRMARGQLEYTINELDKSVPAKLKENLQNITRRMDRIYNGTNLATLVYRSKDYEYVSKAIIENIEVFSSLLDPLTIGTMGTQKPFRFNFEQYVQETRTKMPTRKAADACMMQLLISAMETQNQADGSCEMTSECQAQLMQGSGLGFQQTSRVRGIVLARLFDCMEGVDLSAQIYKLCIQVYKETKSLEAWDHPAGTRTLFMQQILYCASQGYGEFIKPRWMNKIVSWQEPKGCYADDRQPFLRLTGFVGPASSAPPKDREEHYRVKKAAASEGGSCNSLTSAMALGSLVIYVRALLETDQAFQYDVLV
ncbi:jg8558 [Pararge aegeria aegeria]|uniref:Jg8558 protein n=1 Tax=Pararge aegeria aegeria TaxID=348720 RepID=A0A8S4RGJ0_9NEOP|nr:jg8558 [Pararge aegeria aegeria]